MSELLYVKITKLWSSSGVLGASFALHYCGKAILNKISTKGFHISPQLEINHFTTHWPKADYKMLAH